MVATTSPELTSQTVTKPSIEDHGLPKVAATQRSELMVFLAEAGVELGKLDETVALVQEFGRGVPEEDASVLSLGIILEAQGDIQGAGVGPFIGIPASAAAGADADQVHRAVTYVVIAVSDEVLRREFPIAGD